MPDAESKNQVQHPNLSLGRPPGSLKGRLGGVPHRWFWLLVALQTAVLVLLLVAPGNRDHDAVTREPERHPERMKDLAQELEEQSLDAQAAQAWEEYLEATPGDAEQAEILYHIGKLYAQAERFDEAAAALVRAKRAAGEENQELRHKIGQKLVDCLWQLGLRGAAERETSRLVEVGAEDVGRGKVLATINGEPVTEADLDRMIEQRVDQILAMGGASDNRQRREAMLKQFSSPAIRQRHLKELLKKQLLAREARKRRMDREEEFIRARAALTEELLGQRLLAEELGKIQPTPVDLEAFYQANLQQYQVPESIRVVAIALKKDEDPTAVLEGVKSADDFRQMAVKRENPDAAEGDKASSRLLHRGSDDAELGKTDALFAFEAGQWTTEAHVHAGRRFLVLVEERTPSRTPPLEEIVARVEFDYRMRKQEELSQRLTQRLMSEYEVKILPQPVEAPPTADAQDGTNDNQEKSR